MSKTTPDEPEPDRESLYGASPGGPVSSTGHPETPAPEPTPFTEPGEMEPAGTGPSIDPDLAEPPSVASAEPASSTTKPPRGPKPTLAGRVWVAIACTVILLVLIIIFIAENTRSVTINFLGAHGHLSLGLALLVAIVVGVVITLLVGSARIFQLSLEVRRNQRQLRKLS